MKPIKKIFIILLCLFLAAGSFCAYEIYISYHHLTVSDYTVKSDKIQNNINIIMISDLHDHEFGEKNHELVKKIREQHPDLILMVGDMLNDISENSHVAIDIIQQLKEVAPVYYSLGNHEEGYIKTKDESLIQKLKNAGAVVLDKEYKNISIRGNNLTIGGIYDYAFAVDGAGHMSKKDMKPKDLKFLESFQAEDSFKIMMAHRPDSFIFGEAADTWNIDLVVSGHNHGGQVILPGIGGLYGGDQGWFPEYADGIHHFKAVKNMIITRGLGTHKEKLPRFHNVPEIVHITLKAE